MIFQPLRLHTQPSRFYGSEVDRTCEPDESARERGEALLITADSNILSKKYLSFIGYIQAKLYSSKQQFTVAICRYSALNEVYSISTTHQPPASLYISDNTPAPQPSLPCSYLRSFTHRESSHLTSDTCSIQHHPPLAAYPSFLLTSTFEHGQRICFLIVEASVGHSIPMGIPCPLQGVPTECHPSGLRHPFQHQALPGRASGRLKLLRQLRCWTSVRMPLLPSYHFGYLS